MHILVDYIYKKNKVYKFNNTPFQVIQKDDKNVRSHCDLHCVMCCCPLSHPLYNQTSRTYCNECQIQDKRIKSLL